MEAIQLIYTGKLKSLVDTKHLEQAFGFLGIEYAKDTVKINDGRLRSALKKTGPTYEPVYNYLPPSSLLPSLNPIEYNYGSYYGPVSDWDQDTAVFFSPQDPVRIDSAVRSEKYPDPIYETSPYSAYNSASLTPQAIRFYGGIPAKRSVPPNPAQSIGHSRTLPRNIHFTTQLNRPASNAIVNGPSNFRKFHGFQF